MGRHEPARFPPGEEGEVVMFAHFFARGVSLNRVLDETAQTIRENCGVTLGDRTRHLELVRWNDKPPGRQKRAGLRLVCRLTRYRALDALFIELHYIEV